MTPAWLQEVPEGVILSLYVQPRASKNQVVGTQDQELKVRLTSPPVDGAANKLCCEYLARLLGVARGAAELLAGEASRHKRLLVRGVSREAALKVLLEMSCK